MARQTLLWCAAVAALLFSGQSLAQASFDDLAAAVDEQAVQDQSAAKPRRAASRNAAPTRPLLHSYGSSPRVSVNVGVPLGRHAFASYSPAFGDYKRGHLGFRGHFRDRRGFYRGGRYCPPSYYGRRGRW